jgi:hypothetical protein
MYSYILKRLRQLLASKPDAAVIEAADDLMQLWGAAAFDRVTELSWHEDSGLVHSPQPNHWWNVRREIGRRLDRMEGEPRADFAPQLTLHGHQEIVSTGIVTLPVFACQERRESSARVRKFSTLGFRAASQNDPKHDYTGLT